VTPALIAGTCVAAIAALAAAVMPSAVGARQTAVAAASSRALLAQQLAQGILPSTGHGRLTQRLTDADVTSSVASRFAAKAAPRSSTLAHTSSVGAPPSTADCVAATGLACYSARQLAVAYGAVRAHRAGWTGRGATVVLPIWYGAPEADLKHDLQVLSAAYQLPAPQLQVVTSGPIAPMPAPGDADADAAARYSIAEETTLDASAIHAMAPDAHIVVLETPATDPADGGYAEILSAVDDYTRTHPGVIVSMSYGTYESDLGATTLQRLNGRLASLAHRRRLTFMAANGDTGDTSGEDTQPAVPWPASSPQVLAVAGTRVSLDADGHRTSPDTVWGDTFGLGLATGGGLSTVFARSWWQAPYASQAGSRRGSSDIAADASIESRFIFFSTFNVLGGGIDRDGGWRRAAGTSVATPLVAGVIVLARQAARHPLGVVAPALYRAAAAGAGGGISDVVSGSNAVPGNAGYTARPGWDVVSGVGTIGDAARLIPALAAASPPATPAA